ncbi:hypothetical protein HMPREF9140_00202 [Prevotella micans F0438]|uniref:Uncharacterized protein n=1 Tax=Prevotella micans F0438 TaxID=883158 RepID=H1PZW4_9BACT|nr:hypothetical protein HMPREF9140_00202 [Prevotella micans F0438]
MQFSYNSIVHQFERIKGRPKLPYRDLCKTYHPLNSHPYTLRRINIFDQKIPLEVIFE